jgi:hypothetical protein
MATVLPDLTLLELFRKIGSPLKLVPRLRHRIPQVVTNRGIEADLMKIPGPALFLV